MSTQTHERLKELEGELLGLVNVASPAPAMRERIHRLVTLAARAAYALAKEEDGVGYTDHVYAQMAAERFPLPPKRVLREEPDPNGGDVFWRWNLHLEYRPWNGNVWVSLVSDANMRVFAPYPERIDLWHSLKHDPYREVPDNGDE